ncbi:hypothetical protein AB0J80_10885 [Actinoplanes sp. NPDC049548]|uniref:BP74-related protein n=1 Tax=Actinoplanes sp. NPDC049548 TaxID=3155152 RepID=UPI00342133C8
MQTRKIALMAAATLGALSLGIVPAFAADDAGTTPAIGTPAVDGSAGAVIATVQVGPDAANRFRMRVTDPAAIAQVRANHAGTEEWPTHPIGTIVYGKGSGDNTGYSWYLTDVQMVEMSAEVCDGLPSYVERHAVTSPYYCPWAAKVVAIEEV